MKGSSILRKQTAGTGVVAGLYCFDGRTKQSEKGEPQRQLGGACKLWMYAQPLDDARRAPRCFKL
jgi:hypothetical protein